MFFLFNLMLVITVCVHCSEHSATLCL